MSLDALVVGAGPVGLTMACELARHGIGCRIIDAAAERSQTSKALAIFPRTLEVFEMMGFVDRVLVIFPFEEPLYRREGVDVLFVGHPLVDLARASEPRDVFLRSRHRHQHVHLRPAPNGCNG